jgi:hypothetical protein
MESEDTALTQDEALELLAYMLSSVQDCAKSPYYAVYRLVTAAERLARIWAPRASGSLAAYLHDLAMQTPSRASQMDADADGFQEFMSVQVRKLALEVRQRAGVGEGKYEP